LDVFRGLTIALMILVNMAGASDHCYYALDHAPWIGWTPTDLVFPFFLFAVGMAIAVTSKAGRSRSQTYPKILKRAALLFAIGALGQCLDPNPAGGVRLMGILQRIGLCYLFAAVISFELSVRAQLALCAAILFGYWAAVCLIPVPGFGAGVLTREASLPSYIDRLLLGRGHLYYGDGWNGAGDPEGLFSTLPAIVSTMIGCFAGRWVRDKKPASRLSIDLLVAGLALITLGTAWSWSFPIIKKIWTSSYALFMGGWALLVFGACYEFAEVRGKKKWLEPFEHFGRNSLAAFVGSLLVMHVLEVITVGSGPSPSAFEWIIRRVFEPWLDPYSASAAFAVATVVVWWQVLRWMDRRGWHFKA
jgi:predicted acyltransferase